MLKETAEPAESVGNPTESAEFVMTSPKDPRGPTDHIRPGGLTALDGYKPRTRPPSGHAVLNVSSTEQRIRRVVGRAVEEFHDVLWHNQHHGRETEVATYPPAPFIPDPGDIPA